MHYRELFLTSVISTAITFTLAVQVRAQDRWAGFYGGISLDAVDTTSNVGTNATHSYSQNGASLGLYAGYNIVRSSGFVWGPEVSLTGVNASGTRTDATLGTSKFEGGFVLNPRMRLGYATDRAFYYGMIGLGITDAGAQPASNTGTDIYVSGSIGVGAEFALNDVWSTKIEAVHYTWEDDDKSYNGSSQVLDTKTTQITLGLSRKF
ncbi:MAG: hypothetical protein ACI84R_000863 [Candidatus Azotimanducaceae bacterium]|jgi:hypothetical protein